MKVAVIGPTGVLGRALIPQLLEAGYAVRAVARSGRKAQTLFSAHVEIVEYDLLAPDNGNRLPDAIAGCEAVLHIATSIPADFNAPHAWDVNNRLRTEGVERLLHASLAVNAQRYVQQSITMAYPDHGDEWITEDMPLGLGPIVIAMENLVRSVEVDRLAWTIVRGGTFVGPATFQVDTIERLRAGREVVPGDGRNFVALIHVADMASAIVAALDRAPAGSTFNIVAEPVRNGAYRDRLAATIGVPAPPRDPTLPRPPSWRSSNAAARQTLKWSPTHGLYPSKES